MRRTRDRTEPARVLAICPRDHASAGAGGLDLFDRAARGVQDADTRRELRSLAQDVAQDRAAPVQLVHRLGVPRPRVGEVLVGWAETVARVKPNRTLVRRSPLSDVVEGVTMCRGSRAYGNGPSTAPSAPEALLP